MPVSLPRFIKKAFATDGLKATIPDASNNATGRAGYDKGFPPINMQPQEAGGIPPRGEDMNGVIYDVTLAISYIQSGKSFPFNSDFAIAIGGYPSGAIVSDSSNSTLWLNGISNNSSFPTGWTNFSFSDPTETIRGAPLVANQFETNGGEDDSKIVTPKKLRFGFGIRLQTKGFITFPPWMGGLIIQWDTAPCVQTATTTLIYQIPFPNSVLQVVASGYNASGGQQAYVVVNGTDRFQANFNAFYTPGGGPPVLAPAGGVHIKYIAIGY